MRSTSSIVLGCTANVVMRAYMVCLLIRYRPANALSIAAPAFPKRSTGASRALHGAPFAPKASRSGRCSAVVDRGGGCPCVWYLAAGKELDALDPPPSRVYHGPVDSGRCPGTRGR